MSKAKFVELSRESVGEQADFLSDALFRWTGNITTSQLGNTQILAAERANVRS